MVNWSAPLEAVHTDGRRVPLPRGAISVANGRKMTEYAGQGIPCVWEADGRPSTTYMSAYKEGWSIRNVPPADDSDVRADMERLVRTMSARETRAKVDYAEARRIAASLAPTVSPDTLTVREVVAKVYDTAGQSDNARSVRAGTADDWPIMTAALAAFAVAARA